MAGAALVASLLAGGGAQAATDLDAFSLNTTAEGSLGDQAAVLAIPVDLSGSFSGSFSGSAQGEAAPIPDQAITLSLTGTWKDTAGNTGTATLQANGTGHIQVDPGLPPTMTHTLSFSLMIKLGVGKDAAGTPLVTNPWGTDRPLSLVSEAAVEVSTALSSFPPAPGSVYHLDAAMRLLNEAGQPEQAGYRYVGDVTPT